jgi:hypothetical protein
MKKLWMAIISLGALISAPAFAQDTYESYESDSTTVRQESEVKQGVFDSPVTLALDAGVLSFQQPASPGSAIDNLDRDSRFMGGLRLNWDFTNLGGDTNAIHAGLGTGLYYSRLNVASPIGSVTGEESGSNFFMIPLNLQLGTTLGGNFHLAVIGGANGLVSANDGAFDFQSDGDGSSSFSIYPNAGLILGVGFGRAMGLELRGDYTFTPGTDLISATAGLVFPLG